MIYEWREKEFRNFGDAFSELISDFIDEKELRIMKSRKDEAHFLIGSHIHNHTISYFAKRGYLLYFHGCGWRGEELSTHLLEFCFFNGVRGPQTKLALEKAKVREQSFPIEVVGDPAYKLLENLEIPKGVHGDSILMPHVGDSDWWSYDLNELGVEKLEEAKVQNRDDIENKIETVSGSSFVLSGAMHGCIVADYYDVPFAPFGISWVDCAPKWVDWMESRGYDSSELKFCKTLEEGKNWYDRVIAPRKN